jgi:hypothetical protein
MPVVSFTQSPTTLTRTKGDSESKTDETELIIEAQDDGRWCIKSKKYGWYIGNNPEIERAAFEADKQEKHMWTVHLAMHPQVCLRNIQRRAYVHLDEGQLCTDELIPWGEDATITMHFFSDDGTCVGGGGGGGGGGGPRPPPPPPPPPPTLI